MEKILVINPGSTSTKIAVYEDDRQLFVNSIEHADEEIEKYDAIYDQYEFRKKLVLEELEKKYSGTLIGDYISCFLEKDRSAMEEKALYYGLQALLETSR